MNPRANGGGSGLTDVVRQLDRRADVVLDLLRPIREDTDGTDDERRLVKSFWVLFERRDDQRDALEGLAESYQKVKE